MKAIQYSVSLYLHTVNNLSLLGYSNTTRTNLLSLVVIEFTISERLPVVTSQMRSLYINAGRYLGVGGVVYCNISCTHSLYPPTGFSAAPDLQQGGSCSTNQKQRWLSHLSILHRSNCISEAWTCCHCSHTYCACMKRRNVLFLFPFTLRHDIAVH